MLVAGLFEEGKWVTLTIVVLGHQYLDRSERVVPAFGPVGAHHFFDHGDGLHLVRIGTGYSHATPAGVGGHGGQDEQVQCQRDLGFGTIAVIRDAHRPRAGAVDASVDRTDQPDAVGQEQIDRVGDERRATDVVALGHRQHGRNLLGNLCDLGLRRGFRGQQPACPEPIYHGLDPGNGGAGFWVHDHVAGAGEL